MAEDQRAELVRKMVAEGTSDDDIRATLKVFDAQRPQSDVRSRPLLTGLTDAGAARQFSDPAAMKDLNDAKNAAANVGIAMGGAALGGATAGSVAPGVVQGLGRGVLYAGSYKALTAMGIPPEAAAILVGAAGLGKGSAKPSAPEGPPPRMIRVGDTMVERYLPNRSASPQAGDPNAAAFPFEHSIVDRYMPNRGAASHTADTSAPSAASAAFRVAPASSPSAPESIIPKLSDLRPTIRHIDPADMPRSWHAFQDTASRESADPVVLRQAQQLHKELAEMDSRYRSVTANERAMMQAQPQSFKDALIALLSQGGS